MYENQIYKFLLIIIVVVAILTLAASGNFGPKADALAEQIRVQTWVNAAREALELRAGAKSLDKRINSQQQLPEARLRGLD